LVWRILYKHLRIDCTKGVIIAMLRVKSRI
jgi:hypothetical protein